jgi:hypothetical protein
MKKEIHVLGLGPGIENYGENRKEPVTTIGVNDIWRYFETDYVLCTDKLSAFSEERLKVITYCNPLEFYTCWPEWQFVKKMAGKFVEMIELDNKIPGRGGLVESLDSDSVVPFHVDSTFTAVCLAYRMMKNEPGEGSIVMFGCRFLGHHQLQNFIKPIQDSYWRLYCALLEKNIMLYNADEKSALYDVLPFYE